MEENLKQNSVAPLKGGVLSCLYDTYKNCLLQNYVLYVDGFQRVVNVKLSYIYYNICVYCVYFFKLVSVCLNYLVRLFALITVETSMNIMYISSSILN